MNNFTVLKTEPFSDYAKLVDVYGQGCNYPTKKGIDSYQVNFTVAVADKTFNISFQTAERYDNIMAYNGYEMCLTANYGNFGNESHEFSDYCEAHSIEGYEEFLAELELEAEKLAKAELEYLERDPFQPLEDY
jgi:hypothetical protein